MKQSEINQVKNANFVKMIRFLHILVMIVLSLHVFAIDINEKMSAYGLVDVGSVVPNIMIDLIYAGENNFVGKQMYDSLSHAYLHRDAANGIRLASEKLQELYPGYKLKITDAARPMSVQRKMFLMVAGTSKARYVSNPARGGGQHNYGVAVDITIIDDKGVELDMGTPIDYLGPESHTTSELQLMKIGKLTSSQIENRKLLRKVMSAGGFRVLSTEWWHFNFCSRGYARKFLKRLDF